MGNIGIRQGMTIQCLYCILLENLDFGEKKLFRVPWGLLVQIRAVFYIFCFYNFGSLREASVPQIAFRSPSSEVVIGIPVPSVEKSTNPSGDKSGR